MENYIKREPLTDDQLQLAIFGFEIPYLPDFLLDNTLINNDPKTKIDEIIDRFEHLIIGLRKYHDTAVALRYSFNPSTGHISIYLVARCIEDSHSNKKFAKQISMDLISHFSGFGISLKPITNLGKLDQVLTPYKTNQSAVVEIRQKEDIVPIFSIGGDAFVIYPYWQANGPGLLPFETIVNQNNPVDISIYLEPTEITNIEYEGFFQAAQIAQTFADAYLPTQSEFSMKRRVDPGARLVGNIYSKFGQSLQEAFLLVVTVASSEPNTAWIVARSFSSSFVVGQEENHSNCTRKDCHQVLI